MSNTQPETVLDFLKVSTDYLQQKGIESPRLNAELLLATVLNTDRLSLYLKFDYPLSPPEINQFRSALARRGKMEPLQYITGKTQVFHYNFHVDKRVLIPRPETEELADLIIRGETNSAPSSILDIGTGSGILAISLAKAFPEAQITACDISSDSLDVARLNANTLIPEQPIHFIQLDILKTVPSGKFDLIVSNPPYIPTREITYLQPEVRLFEPVQALDGGQDGLDFYRRFADIFPEMMNPGGKIYLEGHADLMKAVNTIFASVLSEGEIIKDMQGNNRFFRGIF